MNKDMNEALPLDRDEITVPALLLKIHKKWTPDMSAGEMYEATRGWWKMRDGRGSRKEKAEYAIALSGGIIREVYVIRPGSWTNDVETPDRWGFEGEAVPGEMRSWVGRDVSDWTRKLQTGFSYLNCG